MGVEHQIANGPVGSGEDGAAGVLEADAAGHFNGAASAGACAALGADRAVHYRIIAADDAHLAAVAAGQRVSIDLGRAVHVRAHGGGQAAAGQGGAADHHRSAARIARDVDAAAVLHADVIAQQFHRAADLPRPDGRGIDAAVDLR